MRARYPDQQGFAERDGVRLFYEIYGDGDPTLFFMAPSWATHSRAWKAQIPYLARHFRVVAYDARGAGRSDRPASTDAYAASEFAADALAVLDATETERAVPVTISASTPHGLILAASQAERIAGACFIGPFFPLRGRAPEWMTNAFDERRESYEGFEMYNRNRMLSDWRGFLEMWSAKCYPEPHSTKQIEDGIRYGMEADNRVGIRVLDESGIGAAGSVAAMMDGALAESLESVATGVRCPALVVTGDLDAISPPAWAEALAETLPHGRLEVFEGSGHVPNGRYPVRFNLVLREFVESLGQRGDDRVGHLARADLDLGREVGRRRDL